MRYRSTTPLGFQSRVSLELSFHAGCTEYETADEDGIDEGFESSASFGCCDGPDRGGLCLLNDVLVLLPGRPQATKTSTEPVIHSQDLPFYIYKHFVKP